MKEKLWEERLAEVNRALRDENIDYFYYLDLLSLKQGIQTRHDVVRPGSPFPQEIQERIRQECLDGLEKHYEDLFPECPEE